MPIYAAERFEIMAGESRNFAVGYIGALDTGELLTGTPTITQSSGSDLTLSDKAVSTSELTINGVTHASGQAVTFKAVCAADPTDGQQEIKISVGTDATVAQTIIRHLKIDVIS